MQFFSPKKTPDLRSTLDELWSIPSPSVAAGKAVEASASISMSPLHVFFSSIPKKESNLGMDGALMSFSLWSIP